jgi:hypothetical protein
MHNRCSNPNEPSYKNYGGRGIAVCDRWASFEAFAADMGERPANHSIDRIDNDGPYSPENCRWATKAEQARNSRRTVMLTHEGETLCLKDWSTRLGIPYARMQYRYSRGWAVAEILFGKH